MSTTDQLKQQIAPATAAAQQQTAVVQSAKQPTTLLGVVRSPSFQKQMALAMPKSMTPDRLTRIVMTECRKTPALMKCAPESFYGAVLQCAALGLEPGSALGHCYLLPFGNGKDKSGRPNAQLIIGYRGMIDLARRSGQIISLQAWTVHAQDTFNYQLGLNPDIEHVPASVADRGPVTHVYAVAKLKGGGVQFEVMSRAEIEKIRSASKAGNSGPWSSHWDEMAKKTVIRRLFKYLPVSIEAVRAVEIDEKTDRGEATTDQDFLDAEFIEKGNVDDYIDEAPAE
ncbi:MAG: recombination protein RecT [Sutterella wadsworthensis]|nr:recombination protein RecT [Sutterella wadsworthensis]